MSSGFIGVLAVGWLLAAGGPATRPATRVATKPTTGPAGALPAPEAERVRGLVQALGDADPDARQEALDALREVGRDAAPYLIEGLADASAAVRAGCARALGLVGGASALQPLSGRLLGDEAGEVRAASADALGALGQVAGLAALSRALGDADANVRSAAGLSVGQAVRIARGRGALSAEEQAQVRAAVGPLIDALRDPQAPVRGNAAISLGALRDGQALAALALASLDQDPLVRASVCHGLEELGDRAAGGALVELLDDADVTVRRSAIEALERIAGFTLSYQPRGPEPERRAAIARWRAWWERTKRQLQEEERQKQAPRP